MVFSVVFRIAQARNFKGKSMEKITGPGTLMLNTPLMYPQYWEQKWDHLGSDFSYSLFVTS
jgi:hypothetical protein